jgi:hypothetical protein
MIALLKKYWEYVAVAVMGVVGVLFALFESKSGQVDALQAQVNLADTNKKADVIEAKVNEQLADANAKQGQINTDQATVAALEAKRQELPKQDLSSTQIEEFWNQKK